MPSLILRAVILLKTPVPKECGGKNSGGFDHPQAAAALLDPWARSFTRPAHPDIMLHGNFGVKKSRGTCTLFYFKNIET